MRHQAVRALLAVSLILTFSGITVRARKKNAAEDRQWSGQIAKDQQVLHALNRLTFGPRPGDVENVQRIGLKKWIDQQLPPERIPENPVLEAKLQPLSTLRMSSRQIAENYPPPQVIKQIADGQLPPPSDPERWLVIERLVRRYRQKQNPNGGDAEADKPTLE